MSEPKPGEVYRHGEIEGTWARVVGVSGNSITFEVLDVHHPEWQGGAGMPLSLFPTIYPDGPYYALPDDADKAPGEYARMVNAPLRPETIKAIRARIAEGDLPVHPVRRRNLRERWTAWAGALTPAEREVLWDALEDLRATDR